jgi:hypothetical protein
MALAPNAVSAVSAPAAPSWNPLKFTGTDLPTELLIMVKTLALVVLMVNHVRILPDPWLPFVPGIDRLPAVLFQRTLQVVFVTSALALLFNRHVRLASLILGATMLLAVVSSKAYYGNNKTFCGLMFFLTGLYSPGGSAWPVRWQLGITYFGAGLNKLLDPDWHTGVFFENWAVQRLHQPWYMALDSILPPLWMGRFMCWLTIVTELGVVPAIFIRQWNYWAICANVFFQSGLLLFTGTTFTLFFYSMTAASLAFVSWPKTPVRVAHTPNHRLKFLQFWDLDHRFIWTPVPTSTPWLQVRTGAQTYTNFQALRMIVLLNPLTYLLIAALIAAAPEFQAAAYRRAVVATSLILLMPPLAWLADKLLTPHP